MRNFNETGVMFTDEQRKQIANTILGFRNCFPYSIETIKKEFVVGNVKFRFIITNNGEIVSVSVECAVKGSNGRYGNMLCYAYDEFKPFNPKPDVWKFRLIEVVLRDILGVVDSKDVAPVAEANENQNQVEDNATISNTPNLDEVAGKVEDYLREYIKDNAQVMLGDFDNYKIFMPIGEWRRVFEEHIDKDIDPSTYMERFGTDDILTIIFAFETRANYEGIIFEFFNENMPNHFNNTEEDVFYYMPDIIDGWSDYVYDWAYGMLGDKGSQFNELEEVFQDYEVPTLFTDFMRDELDFDEEGLAYCIYDDMSEHLVNPIEVFNELVEEANKWVVIAKCSDGDIVIHKDGEIAFDIDIAGEIAKDHQNMGAEIEIMRYADYKEMYN
jgi:hypothetical protein